MKTVTELREMNQAELENELLSLRKEQFNLRLKKATGALEKTDVFSKVKKSIARIKTIMTEKAGE